MNLNRNVYTATMKQVNFPNRQRNKRNEFFYLHAHQLDSLPSKFIIHLVQGPLSRDSKKKTMYSVLFWFSQSYNFRHYLPQVSTLYHLLAGKTILKLRNERSLRIQKILIGIPFSCLSVFLVLASSFSLCFSNSR